MRQEILNVKGYSIRNGIPDDHGRIISVMKDWWGGRDLSSAMLKVFFIHFRNTIFIVEKENELAGFLVGYFIPLWPEEAYIHFVGTNPNMRKIGIGRLLYEHFFDLCKEHGRTTVRACTAPVNADSIEFHRRMGFEIEPGNAEIGGWPVTLDYLGKNDHKVLFVKKL
jgi:ribosomal protein S18 acetylase RimI-like enzyme